MYCLKQLHINPIKNIHSNVSLKHVVENMLPNLSLLHEEQVNHQHVKNIYELCSVLISQYSVSEYTNYYFRPTKYSFKAKDIILGMPDILWKNNSAAQLDFTPFVTYLRNRKLIIPYPNWSVKEAKSELTEPEL